MPSTLSWKTQSYEAVPALTLRGPALRWALRRVTIAWMIGVIWAALISGSRLRILAEMMGFNDFTLGVLGSLPFVATFGQIIASLLIQRTGGLLKYQFIECAVVHRALWLVAAVIPIVLPIPSTLAVVALLVTLAVSWFLGALSSPPWITWMGALIPRRIRGRYFANRERICQLVMTAVILASASMLTLFYDKDLKGIQWPAIYYICALLAVAAVCGTIDILLFYKIPEVLPVPSGRGDVRGSEGVLRFLHRMLIQPLGDRVFRHYVLFGTTMSFSMTVAGWYFWCNALDHDRLHWSPLATDVLFLVIGPLGGIGSAPLWGKAIDRWGRRPVLMACTVGAILCIVPWFFIMPWMGYALAIVACLLGAASWTAISLAQTSIVLGFADGTGQSRYIAASAVLISMGGAAGGWLGGALTQWLVHLQTAPIVLGPFSWTNYHVAFLLVVLSRIGGLFWLIGMPDPGAGSTWHMVRTMGTNVYNLVSTRLFYPLRAFGWMHEGDRKTAPGPSVERERDETVR
jgi:MFS family permease